MTGKSEGAASLRAELEEYRKAAAIPDGTLLAALLKAVNATLSAEAAAMRPRDSDGEPGGLVELEKGIATVLLPDIHARPSLVSAALDYALPDAQSVFEGLVSGSVQLVCLGDYFHGEARVKRRWQRAESEFLDGFESHTVMDQEMAESLSVLMLIARLKSAFPSRVHLLKGNHENVKNESSHGNQPFGKYAYEGEMVFEYLRLMYTQGLVDAVAEFEKRLPLLAVGRHFLVSHAEPEEFYPRTDVIGYRHHENVVYGLTWTDNDQAAAGSVQRMLDHYLGGEEALTALYFGGHRPVSERFSLRAGGRYVQIHNPLRYILGLLPPDRPADLDRDIIDLGAGKDAIDGQNA